MGIADAARLPGFPWPFVGHGYRYSANVEPAPAPRTTAVGGWGDTLLAIDGDYADEIAQREAILSRDPQRHVVLPHMRAASWDALLWGLRRLSAEYSDLSLAQTGDAFVWTNPRLGVCQAFRFADEASLPVPPLVFLCSQMQEDALLLDEREGQLWVDGGCVTFASNWPLSFDIGLSFAAIHRPVPRAVSDAVIPRAERFLLQLAPDAPFRRLNWSATAGRRLDTALDSRTEWGPSRGALATCTDFAGRFHLRVEVQHLIRLPQSGAILFLIRTYLLPLAQIMTVPDWRAEFAEAVVTLSPEMLDYKGLTAIRDRLLYHLR